MVYIFSKKSEKIKDKKKLTIANDKMENISLVKR